MSKSLANERDEIRMRRSSLNDAQSLCSDVTGQLTTNATPDKRTIDAKDINGHGIHAENSSSSIHQSLPRNFRRLSQQDQASVIPLFQMTNNNVDKAIASQQGQQIDPKSGAKMAGGSVQSGGTGVVGIGKKMTVGSASGIVSSSASGVSGRMEATRVDAEQFIDSMLRETIGQYNTADLTADEAQEEQGGCSLLGILTLKTIVFWHLHISCTLRVKV